MQTIQFENRELLGGVTDHLLQQQPAAGNVQSVEAAPASSVTVRSPRGALRWKALGDVLLMAFTAWVTACLSKSGDFTLWVVAAVAWVALALKLVSHSGKVCAGRCPLCNEPNQVSRAAHVFCCSSCQTELMRVRLPAAGNRTTQWFKPWRVGG